MAFDPALVVGDVMRVTVEARLLNQLMQTSFHYRVQTIPVPGAPGGYAAMAASFGAEVWADLRTFLSDQVGLVRLRIQKVHPQPKILAVYFDPANAEGVLDTALLPPSTAIVTRCYSENATRYGRGRNYIFGCTVTDGLEGVIVPARVALWRDLAVSMYEEDLDSDGFEFQPIIFTPANLAANPPTVARLQDIVASDVNTVLRNQRRRQIGVGQ